VTRTAEASEQKIKKESATAINALIKDAKQRAAFFDQNIRNSYNEIIIDIARFSDSIENELIFDPKWMDAEITAQRVRLSRNFTKRHRGIDKLIVAMAASYKFFQDHCKNSEIKNKFEEDRILTRMNSIEDQIKRSLADASERDETLAMVAENVAIISATDPNVPLLLDPENKGNWRSFVSLSKGFGSFGKGEMVIVQNSLADYRVKTLKNDITEAVKGMTGLIQESVRAVALAYGVPLPQGQTGGGQSQGSPQTNGSLPDIQADIDLTEKRREALSLIKRDLRVFVSSRIRMYEVTAANDVDARNKILAEVRGRIKDAINWIDNNTTQDASQNR